MAVVFKLKHGSTEALFTAGAEAGLRYVSWQPKATAPAYGAELEPVVETIELSAEATTDDLLATSVQALDAMRVWAEQYMSDPATETPVFLHAKMEGETGERCALVRRIDLEWDTNQFGAVGHPSTHRAKVKLKVLREPWESTTSLDCGALAETAAAAIEWDYTTGGTSHDLVGDVSARIEYVRLRSDGTGARFGRLWAGFKSVKHGTTPANFEPIWECEDTDATAGTDCGAPTTDSGASPGGEGNTKRVVSFATTETWAKRLTIELKDITSNHADNFGDFLWMLRYKLDANATEVEVQLRWGYTGMADADFVRGPIKEITKTDWDYEELGRMPIPLRNLNAMPTSVLFAAYDATYCVQIWARRTSGSATLNLDCLVLVPIDEGWVKVWKFDVAADADGNLVFAEGASGQTTCAVYDGSAQISFVPAFACSNFRVPLGDGRIIVVYAAPASHDITTGISLVSFKYRERWLNLRGGE